MSWKKNSNKSKSIKRVPASGVRSIRKNNTFEKYLNKAYREQSAHPEEVNHLIEELKFLKKDYKITH